MTAIPQDLVPLPTAPYSERPQSMPLDREECRTALWRTRGNVTKAAELLKVAPQRLRKFVKGSAYLTAEMEEAKEQILDIVDENIVEALTDDQDKGRKDAMTRFVAASLGRTRGYGSGNAKININANGPVSISWDNGDVLTGTSASNDEDNTIEGEVVSG